MAQFVCRMALPTGEIVERTVVADSEAALRRELEDKDMLVLELRRQNPVLSAIGEALSRCDRASPRASSSSSIRSSRRCSAPAFRS